MSTINRARPPAHEHGRGTSGEVDPRRNMDVRAERTHEAMDAIDVRYLAHAAARSMPDADPVLRAIPRLKE
jgi:hypothetical protein